MISFCYCCEKNTRWEVRPDLERCEACGARIIGDSAAREAARARQAMNRLVDKKNIVVRNGEIVFQVPPEALVHAQWAVANGRLAWADETQTAVKLLPHDDLRMN